MTVSPGPSERQPAESARAFEAFRIYLELGPSRSTATVGERLGHRSARQAEKWCARHGWVERVREFESRAAATADRAALSVIAQRSKRQAEIAQLHGEVTALVASAVVRHVQSHPDELEKLDLADKLRLEAMMARAHNRVVVTERLALGISTENPAPADASRTAAEEEAKRLSDEELAAKLAGFDELGVARANRRNRQRPDHGADVAHDASPVDTRPNARPAERRPADAPTPRRARRTSLDDLRDRINHAHQED